MFARSGEPLAALLETVERLVAGGASGLDGPGIGIAVGVACAQAMAEAARWAEAALLFENAAAACRREGAPALEWRCWDAAGRAREAMGNDAGALTDYRRAMDRIEELWFALLDEDRLRGFFRDKAHLYERAGICCLRLGHDGLAIECLERAKTRYLGDLIARRHRAARAGLAREIEDLWTELDRAIPRRARVSRAAAARGSAPQIVGTA